MTSEDIVLQEIKNRGSFKAMPLNKKLFDRPLGVPKVEKMPSTEIQCFKLSTENIKSKPTICTPKKFQFKAIELNKKIFDTPLNVFLERKSAPPLPCEFLEFKFQTD
jgi:hypothetical protein